MVKFSIIIAVAPWRDAEILKYLEELDYPINEYEIIIEKGRNPSNNRNRGAEKANGKFIVFIDDDALIDKFHLKRIENFFEKYPNIDIVGGPQLTPRDDKLFGKLSGYALSSFFYGGPLCNRYKKGKINFNANENYLTSANLICKKQIFKKIKFNPKLWPGEDPEFLANAKNHGFKIVYSPNIFIYHRRRNNLKKLIYQFYNYGKTRIEKEKFRKADFSLMFMIPALFFLYLYIIAYLLLISIISSYFILGYIVSAPLIAYILLSLLFSFIQTIKNKNPLLLFVLPFIFVIIHLSYGLGIIIGLANK